MYLIDDRVVLQLNMWVPFPALSGIFCSIPMDCATKETISMQKQQPKACNLTTISGSSFAINGLCEL